MENSVIQIRLLAIILISLIGIAVLILIANIDSRHDHQLLDHSGTRRSGRGRRDARWQRYSSDVVFVGKVSENILPCGARSLSDIT